MTREGPYWFFPRPLAASPLASVSLFFALPDLSHELICATQSHVTQSHV